MVLEKINIPNDIRRLNLNNLDILANEIRQYIIEVVSKNGGHLASNLGTVELTLALHYVYNTPLDKIIWDVGHQSYTHKIITGRKEKFKTIRKFKGLSGFNKRSESNYDHFGVGHASTSISAALGFAEARDLLNRKYKVLAVIGDGSLSSGMPFEALNQAGHMNKDLTVVLNDNEMSISPNVGALSAYLSNLITNKTYNRFKGEVESLLKQLPNVGTPFANYIKRLEKSIKKMIVPGKFFQELGFKYVGPIDGHCLTHLIETFENVKNLEGPILVHVVTKKGKGYLPSEEDASSYHGVSPFVIESGRMKKSKNLKTFTKVFGETMVELARKDNNIVAITAAMPSGTGLDQFQKEFPDRFYDVGIAEEHAVTFSAGLVCENIKPVVAIYSTFLQRGFDQIIHDIALQNLPVVFALDRGGVVGADGPTHHGVFDLSFLRMIPNLVIMAPSNEEEFKNMLKTAIYLSKPVAIRYPRDTIEVCCDNFEYNFVDIGKSEIVQEGKDIALIGIGSMVRTAIDAMEYWPNNLPQPRIINSKFAKPLDIKLLKETFHNFKYIFTIEENVLAGGFGSAVLEAMEDYLKYPVLVKRLGIGDKFVEHGDRDELLELLKLDPKGIVESIENYIQEEFHRTIINIPNIT